MIPNNLADDLYVQTIQNAAITADGNSTYVDLLNYEGEIAVILAVQDATSGSSPTLAVKLQHCDTTGGSYTDVSGGGFTSYTTSGSIQTISLVRHNLKRYLEINFDIGGTAAPAYPVSAVVLGMKKYQ